MTSDNWDIETKKTSERSVKVTARNVTNVPLLFSLAPRAPKKREANIVSVAALTSLQANPGEVVELAVTFKEPVVDSVSFALGIETPAYVDRIVIEVDE